LYYDTLEQWYLKNAALEWSELRSKALWLLQREEELQEIVRLVGPDALSESQRVILEAAKMIREDFLMQSAYHPVDTYCPIDKCYNMLKVIIKFYDEMKEAVEAGVPIKDVIALPIVEEISRIKFLPKDEAIKVCKELEVKISEQFNSLKVSATRR